MSKSALYITGAVYLALAIWRPVYAQQPGDSGANNSGGLEEVTVTAQRREQSLQDAAIPLATFDQETLTQLGMESAQDLGQLSPSLGITAGGGPLTSLFVRGVGALTVNPQTDAAVSQNYDGVYLGRSSGAAGQALYDLERVELLKGPQGTLYGRNATGGVINYIPVKPILGESSGYLQGEFGNYSRVGLQGAANFALSENAAIRISGNYLNRDGYSDDGANDQDTASVRAQLLVEPSDSLSIRVAVDHSEVNSKGPGGDLVGTFSNTPGSLTDYTPTGLAIDSGPTSDGANAIRLDTLHTPSFAPFQPIDNDNVFQDLSFSGVMADINYSVDSGTFTFIPAYREADHDYAFIGPGFAPAVTKEQNSQTSLELRFATELDGSFNGIVGAFYIEEDISTSGIFAQNYATPMQNYDNGGESWAIFGQGIFDVTDSFRLNAGIRYTDDSKYVEGISDTFVTFCGGSPASGDFLTPGPPNIPNAFNHGCNYIDPATGLPYMPAHPLTTDRDEFIQYFVDQGLIAPDSEATIPGMGPPPVYNYLLPPPPGFGTLPGAPAQIAAFVNVGDGVLSNELNYSETTYRLGVEWDVGEDSLLYATFENGYRAGGVDLSSASPTYDPEYIDAFTIGSKNRFLDNTLQLNAELFYWKYEDQQVTYFTTLNSASAFPIANGDATIQGLDVDVIWAASDRTTISGNVQFLDSTYDSLTLISDPGRGRFGCDSIGVEDGVESYDCSGQSLLYSPEFGADLTVNYIVPLSNFELSLTGNVSHRSEQQTNFIQVEASKSDPYTVLHLDATLSPYDARWALSIYARNVTDERYLKNLNTSNRGLAYSIYSPPRTYGVRFSAQF
jgi:iron complex outermembrane receptor protein